MLRSAFLVGAVMVASGAAHASTGRSMGLYPVQTPNAPLPMVESKVEVVVRGPIVETVVTQRFVNRSDRATEATYIFPLPHDAAVSAMSIRHGGKTIRAAIEPRASAQQRYEDAVRAGVAAAMLDQERPDVFTQTVAAVPAKGTVEITLRYDTLARYADGTWSLVLPLVVAPRYVPGTVSGRPTTGTGRTPDTDRAPDASRVTPPVATGGGGATTVAIQFIDAVREVTSPTHELAVLGTRATFTDPASDHDAVIRWRSAVGAAGWVEQGPGGGFAAVVVEAPAAPARKKPVRLTLVLDRSATMNGDASAMSEPVVRALIGAMTGADRLAVTGSEHIAWTTPSDVLRAIEVAPRRTQAFDLTRVLEAAKPDGAPLLLVTDGLVADDRAALAAAQKLRVPVHVIGVGAAPARGLLVQLAAITGGTVRFALPSDEVGALAKAALADIATPPAPLAVNWGTLAASDVVPAVLPRLGAGQSMLVLARVKKAQTANARVRGELFAIETLAVPRAVDGALAPVGPLARRWGRTKLDELLVGREDERAVTRHALAFGLVSPYTSLVAIGTDVVEQGGVKHTVAVPVAVPAGMHWEVVREETTPELDNAQLAGKLEGKPAVPTSPTKPVVTKKPATDVDSKPMGAPAPAGNEGKTPDQSEDRAKDTKQVREVEGYDRVPSDREAAPAAPVMRDLTAAGAADAEDEAAAEVMSQGMLSHDAGGKRFRFSFALGAGLATQDADRASVLALSGRFDIGARRNLLGVEGSLWLVDGLNGQGRFLFDYTRIGVARWFELGLGLGGHGGGTGVGPAGALVLRGHLPPKPALSGYLRYDGALLQRDARREVQNTVTLGVEWGF
ncbi:MAG: VIT domain-containing protein [Kofleriaceae bacterium]|nr:VIT domain-containing protein [Kofleriaceae bacterium]